MRGAIENIIGYCVTFFLCSFLMVVIFGSWENDNRGACVGIGYWVKVEENKRRNVWYGDLEEEVLVDSRGGAVDGGGGGASKYKVKRGETYYSISRKIDVKVEELMEWNQGRMLKAGSTIFIR